MRNTSTALTFAALISLLGLAACQPIQPPTEGDEAPTAAATPVHTETFDASKYENVWVLAIEEIENEDRSLLRVSYPVTEHEAINVRMEAVTQEFIDEYRTTAAEIEAAYQDYKRETGKKAATFVTHYRQHFDVSIANENLIFFDIVRSIYTGGTGYSYVVGYIFDRRTGAELTIPDLFVDDSYLERLSTLTAEALAKRVSKDELASDLEWIDGGTAPTAENFDNIQIRGDGTILVMFDKYQVAAGVEGVVEVELPLSAIADLLKPEIRQLLGIDAETAAPGTRVVGIMEFEESENDDRSTLYVSYPTTDNEAIAVSDLLRPEIRQLLGIEVDATTLKTDFGQAVARVWTPASSPVAMLAQSPSGRIPTLSRLMRLSTSSSSQVEQAAEGEINCHEVACVALTFDDGPSLYTEGLLDTLKEHDVKATFFVLGTQVRIQSETVLRMFHEGHQIGNHTWDHPNLTQLSDELIQQQLQRTDDLITQIVGVPTQHMRPPYGAHNERVRAASGLPIIFWSVDPLDWRDRNAETVAARIAEAPVGAIILAHDIHKSTVDAVPAIIAALKGRGIHFVTVTKLFEPDTLRPQNVYQSQPNPPSR